MIYGYARVSTDGQDLDTGDELVIAEWDRATRSMWDGLQIIEAVIDAGAAIMVLDRSYIDLETPMGRGCMAMMSAMAEDERLRIIKRTHEGRKIAQRRRSSAWAASRSSPRTRRRRRGSASLRASRPATSPRATVSASARFRGSPHERRASFPRRSGGQHAPILPARGTTKSVHFTNARLRMNLQDDGLPPRSDVRCQRPAGGARPGRGGAAEAYCQHDFSRLNV